jgi:SAM-dependent methyltransferase
MGDGWEESSGAWIRAVGDRGDYGREHVLDPVMMERVSASRFATALDVGCGEGRFCRMLKANGITAVGIDPTENLLAQARQLDPAGDYKIARAEALPFEAETFDLVVSYLTLLDIPDFRAGIREMVRVLKPGGSILIANLNSFISSNSAGWVRDQEGRYLHYPVDRYMEEFPEWVEWSDIRIQNWHRPLAAYMKEFLRNGLTLTFFDEPQPRSGDAERRDRFQRAPWFVVMEWRRPVG